MFLGGDALGLSLTADVVLVLVAGAGLAYAVTRWSVVPRPRPRRSLASALVATTLGTLTPLIALYLLLVLVFGGLGGGMTD